MSDEESMEVTYRLTPEDYWAAVSALAQQNRTFGSSFWFWVNGFLWPLLAAETAYLIVGDDGTAILVLFAAIILRFNVWPWWRRRSYIKRAARSAGAAMGEQTFQISSEGATMTGKVYRLESRWNYFHAISATQKYILFEVTRASALIIPRASFNNKQTAERFLALAQRYHANELARPTPVTNSWPPSPKI